jgi:hypothetical protein
VELPRQLRLRQRVTKGPGSRAAGVATAFKLIESAQTRWRAVNAPHLVALPRGWVGLAFDDESHLLREGAPHFAADLNQPTARYGKESRTARRRAQALLVDRPGRSRIEARDSMRA